MPNINNNLIQSEMKIILKKPLWFTVTTTLCLVVVTLFAASGCDKPEEKKEFCSFVNTEDIDKTLPFVDEFLVDLSTDSSNSFDNEQKSQALVAWLKSQPCIVDADVLNCISPYEFVISFDENGKAKKFFLGTTIGKPDTPLKATGYRKYDNTLEASKWKLAGIVDTQTDELKVLEPQNCEMCYTLAFEPNNTFSGQTVSNTMWCGKYDIDCNTHAFHIIGFGITQVNEVGDGHLYTQILNPFLEKTQSFTVKDTYPRILHLYYNDGKNYLKYKEIGGYDE